MYSPRAKVASFLVLGDLSHKNCEIRLLTIDQPINYNELSYFNVAHTVSTCVLAFVLELCVFFPSGKVAILVPYDTNILYIKFP